MSGRIRFNRHELAGSFGDIGTDLPLIVGMILAAGLDGASVFILFGTLQIVTGLVYGLPMPVQPLKAMAVLVIAQQIEGGVLFAAGLAIGVVMLVLSLSGLLDWLVRAIPQCVVRGVQFGLGLSLARLALGDYVQSSGLEGFILAAVGFAAMALLWGNHRVPAGLVVILLGLVYAISFRLDFATISDGISLALPEFHRPTWANIYTGFFLLTLPQIPLSLSNSVIATHKTIHDLFPERQISVRRIGLTYSLMNLVVPFFSGIPVCHGCGGLAGHYALGARTGGSVVIYGSVFVVIGMFFSRVFEHVIQVFPTPILGVVLVFESLTLMLFVTDQAGNRSNLTIAFLVALCAFTLPQGFVVGLVLGTILYYGADRFGLVRQNH